MPTLTFKAAVAAGLLAALLTSSASASNIGKRFPSEKLTYIDPVTGIPVTALTTAASNDAKIYPTHPQWTADGRYVIFRSNRGDNGTQIFAVNEVSGEIIQVTDTPGTNAGTINIAQKSMKIYFLRNQPIEGATAPAAAPGQPNQAPTRTQMIELNLEALFADSEAGTMKAAEAYERVVAALPVGLRESGGFGLDADEGFAYLGVRGGDTGQHLPPGTQLVTTVEGQRMGAGPAGIRSINLQTGEIKVVLDTPFLMGHVQANPWVAGEIIYCHETGGDAPQRMWTVRADGSGNRPLYPESPEEWVTHEAVITPDEVVFNILGHQGRLRAKPTGIAVVNLRNNQVKLYGQVEELRAGRGGNPPTLGGGFWHSNGSPDGRWLVGDTFNGTLSLIDRASGEIIPLSTDHKMRPDHLHPTFSKDSKRILVQSGHLSNGTHLDLMVVTIPQSLQNRR